jgi:hypothetical protein
VWNTDRKAVMLNLPGMPRRNHWHQWIDGCLKGEQPEANFAFAGRLCESLSVGAAASRFPNRTLTYDAKAIAFTEAPEATATLRKRYRDGWSVKGLDA